jgi:hypothetical protein
MKSLQKSSEVVDVDDTQEERSIYDREDVKARREAQFKLRLQGYKPYKEIVPMLTKEFNCSVEAIRRDWHRRSEWIAEAARTANTDEILAETKGTGEIVQERFREGVQSILSELDKHRDENGDLDWHDELVPLLYGFLRDFLKGTMDVTSEQIKNLAKVGIIQEAPKKVQVEERSVRINMDAFDVLGDEDRIKLFGALFKGGEDGFEN